MALRIAWRFLLDTTLQVKYKMSTLNATLPIACCDHEWIAPAKAFSRPDCFVPATNSTFTELTILDIILKIIFITFPDLCWVMVQSVCCAGLSAFEMIVLSIALLALHYCLLPSDFDFMHKPNHFMPGIKREPSHPRDMFANCKLVMFAVDVANIGLNLTEFCLMLPILMAFLAMHLMGGVVLWCSLPVALRPVRLVLQLYQLIFRRASVTDSKALLEKSFTVVPRGQRSIRLWVQNKVVQLAQTKLKQVLGSLPASILDFLAVTDWDEQFERLMIATARVVHYIFFELVPVVFCHDFFYVVSISQE